MKIQNKSISFALLGVLATTALGGAFAPVAQAKPSSKFKTGAIIGGAALGYGLLKHNKTATIAARPSAATRCIATARRAKRKGVIPALGIKSVTVATGATTTRVDLPNLQNARFFEAGVLLFERPHQTECNARSSCSWRDFSVARRHRHDARGVLPALREQGVDADLAALSPRGENPEESPLWGTHLHLARPLDPFFGYSPDLRPLVESLSRDSSVIHSHGLWFYIDYVAYRVAREMGKPHIISMQGMAEPYIQSRSRLKKAPIEWWFQKRALQRAAVFQAVAPKEIDDIRRLGLTQPVALVPNGVNLKEGPAGSRAELEELFPALKDRRVMLFLGRLHPKKGLPHFLPAWKRSNAYKDDWHLLLAGPDDGGHRAGLEAQIEALGLQNQVTFAGLLTGKMKGAALRHSQAFVLPSHSEGMPLALLEAMGARLPVLDTPGCNFPEAAHAGGAIETPATEEGSLEGLSELLAMSDDERRAMGQRGRA